MRHVYHVQSEDHLALRYDVAAFLNIPINDEALKCVLDELPHDNDSSLHYCNGNHAIAKLNTQAFELVSLPLFVFCASHLDGVLLF